MKRSLFSRLAQSFCAAAVLVGGASAQAALVGYWDFEDNLLDSANDNHGTAGGGGPVFTSDISPILAGSSTKSLSFAGAQHVVIANEQNFDLGDNITVSAWVKGFPGGEWDPYISKNGEPNGWQFRRHGGNQTLDWTTRRSPDNGETDFESVTTGVNNGLWHHILATFDGKVKAIYVDGVLDRKINVTPSAIANSNDAVVFGGRQNPGPGVGNTSFDGLMDNIAIYSTPLAPNQVAFLASGGDAKNLPAATQINFAFGAATNPTQDWTVLGGNVHVRADEGAGITAGTPVGGFAHDPGHANFLIVSPEFHFTGDTIDGTNAIIADFRGGMGDQNGTLNTYNNPADVLAYNGGFTNDLGVKALGIYDLASDQYIGFLADPGDGDGGGTIAALSLADLSAMGMVVGQTYRLDYFDTDQGGWGWNQLNYLSVAGTLGVAAIPEPATALLGVMSVGLLALRRRRAA